MSGNRRWLGWLAIGLGALALLFALGGRGPALQMAGLGGASAPQGYSQQRAEPQSGAAAPDASGQQATGRAGGRMRGSAAPGAVAPQGAGQPAGAGFGRGGRFGFPFKLFGAATRLIPLVLLVGLGLWLIRGRRSASAAAATPAQAPEQPSPTGEFYREESGADEPGDRA